MGKFSGIKTTNNRPYDESLIEKLQEKIKDLPIKKQAAILGTIIEESGGNPLAKSANDTYQGLIQWGQDRYRIKNSNQDQELNSQINLILNTLNNTSDGKSWSHGGEGSGYNSRLDAYNIFNDDNSSLEDMYRAFSFGYVRPKGKEDSYKNRLKVVKQVYNILSRNPQQNIKTSVSNPIQENFWTQWSKIPYKQQGGTIMNQTIKKFKQVRKAQQGDKLLKHLSKQLALDIAYGPQYRGWNEVEKTPIIITKEEEIKTAPKAEDRYKNSKVEGTIATNGPFSHTWVTANSSIPFIIPAKIGRVIEGNDTTYYEIPQRSAVVKVKNRAAKRVTPFMNRWNPGYKSFDFKSWDSKFGPMIEELKPLINDSLEYETLKRRFNTAWNLAKPK